MDYDKAIQNGINARRMIRRLIDEGRTKQEFINLMILLWEDEEQKYLREGLN